MSHIAEPNPVVVEAAARYAVTSIFAEMTLEQAQFHTHISPAIMRRRWKFQKGWEEVIYEIGDEESKVKHQRTTLYLVAVAQEKAAAFARRAELSS